ncbi:MAG: U32 family peptidase [Acetatifactor sp.]|nr:U32 family peptidase [Acetatifactor sp.]
MRNKVELLAPAGSPQAFYGAVSAGADAVYLGGAKFGARAYAENFTEEELVTCIRYGRLFGVKVYLTVNTLLKEQELEELPAYLKPLCEAGLKGVIVQDIGVLARIREAFPALELHASTQMTLCTSYGAELLKSMGVSRIVPARELSLSELAEIKRRTGLELETFIHGAMCYCYSGQCLFSSILGGRSGNRGRCAQPCRLPYRVKNKTKGPCYPLSLKDMCTIDHIPALIEAGIDSFKIEGRMKKPEYAAGVTAIYRKYIDQYYNLRDSLGLEKASKSYQEKRDALQISRDTLRISREDREILTTLYVRSQLQDGYYFKKNGREMVTLTNPAYSGTDEELLERIHREHLQDRPRLGVDVEAEFLTGKPAKVILRRGESVGRAMGNLVQSAKNQPVTEDNLRRQLGKLGESPFAVSGMQLQVSRDAFYPLKEINELRRQAVQALEAALWKAEEQSDRILYRFNDISSSENEKKVRESLSESRRPGWSICKNENRPKQSMKESIPSDSPVKSGVSEKASTGWAISVRTQEQLEALAGYMNGELSTNQLVLRRLYVDGDLLFQESQKCLSLCGQIFNRVLQEKSLEKPKLLAALPYILRENDMSFLEKLWNLTEQYDLDGFLVRSLDELGFLLTKEQESSRRIDLRTDAGVYIWNSETLRQLCPLAEGFCLPYELKASEQSSLLQRVESKFDRISWEKIIYGRIPLMVTANCVQKTTDRCIGEGDGLLWLEDRYHTEFPVLRTCARCLNIIYNSVPLALFDNGERWKNTVDLRLDFTIETGQELTQILQTYLEGNRLSQAHTTGHEKRGVE